MCGLILATASIAADEDSADQDAIRKSAEKKFLDMRTQAVKDMDGDFFVEEKFTPEQVHVFITTRIAAEDRVMARLRKTPGAAFLPSLFAAEMDSGFAEAFNPEVAQRYRMWADTKNVWIFMMEDPILKLKDWLTSEELTNLAQAWGPILADSMNTAYEPTYINASMDEKVALLDQLTGNYITAAKKILGAAKLAILQERFTEMRVAAIKELASPEE